MFVEVFPPSLFPHCCSTIHICILLVFIISELSLICARPDVNSLFEEIVGERKDETGSQSLEHLDSSVFTVDELFLDDK